MSKSKHSFLVGSLIKLLLWWEQKVLQFPWVLLIVTTLLSAGSLFYTAKNLGFYTNTADMLSPDLPFQVNRKRVENAFPKDASTLLLIVDGETPEQTSQVAEKLALQLQQLGNLFESVYIPTDNPFFRQQALLFLDIDELEELTQKLTDAQPFIGHLSENYNLKGLFEIIRLALEEKKETLPMDLVPLLSEIEHILHQRIEQKPQHLSWQNLLAGNKLNTESKRTLVIAKPKMNFSEILPADSALTSAHEISLKLMAEYPAVTIRMTGETALEHEELESVTDGAIFSGIASLMLVCTVLWLGFRSFKLLFTTFIALIMGLALTAGFATVSVGHLNIISVAFAVLYIGLGVDYATHICLRYRECRAEGMTNELAISDSINNIGFSLFLCALTTALGFLAFIPTDYAGVSELGIIASGGMFIGLALSLSIVPALFKVMPLKHVKPFSSSQLHPNVALFPFRYAKPIRIVTLLTAIASCFILTDLEFDSNPINLRNPDSESVKAIRELLKSKTDSPFALIGLTNNLDEALVLADKLEKLPSVHETITLKSFVAEDQEDKLAMLEELDMILGAQLKQFDNPLSPNDQKAVLLDFSETLRKAINAANSSAPLAAMQSLQDTIKKFTSFADKQTSPDLEYSALEENLLELLPYTMQRLSSSLTATDYGLEDLPDYITEHWISADGLYKILITPAKDQNISRNLKEFVREVQTVDDSISGLPVADQASGSAVAESFIEAFGGALAAIILLILIISKSIKETILIVGPLILAALYTGATNVLLDNPFNFANVIALPLLMGMGVDSSIHVVHRLHQGWSNSTDLLQSSTARGVLFSALTTLCSFSSLAFVPHKGTASMGLLLAIGILFMIVCSLIILPAFTSKKIN
ncbi:MAG: MMPL family transporter [Methylomicrobium sp.]|nr:MMPL family transporter [Methylomicrobium sp.]